MPRAKIVQRIVRKVKRQVNFFLAPDFRTYYIKDNLIVTTIISENLTYIYERLSRLAATTLIEPVGCCGPL